MSVGSHTSVAEDSSSLACVGCSRIDRCGTLGYNLQPDRYPGIRALTAAPPLNQGDQKKLVLADPRPSPLEIVGWKKTGGGLPGSCWEKSGGVALRKPLA